MYPTLSRVLQTPLRLARRSIVAAFRGLAWLLLGLVWLWSCLAIWLFRPLPHGITISLTLIWVGLTLGLFTSLSRRTATGYLLVGILLIWGLWSLQTPRNDRDWQAGQARLPQISINGDRIGIVDVRCNAYRSEDDYDVVWERRTLALSQLESVDFVVVPFAASPAMAHVFVTFGFNGGEHLAISVEVRKARGEKYSPLYGLFHRYELMYVIGDESDLIGLRANIRQRPVYLYPVKVGKDQLKCLFLSMLRRAEGLRTAPEFYNTVTNACSSNLLWHVNQVRQQPVRWNWRVLLPGFSDALAFDLGLIDFDGSLEQARTRFCLEGRTVPWTNGKAWSQQIRRHSPSAVVR